MFALSNEGVSAGVLVPEPLLGLVLDPHFRSPNPVDFVPLDPQ